MSGSTTPTDPAERWRKDATLPDIDARSSLRLAAMAGHMRSDRLAARRAALIDVLSGGGVYLGDDLCKAVAAQVGVDCWGKRPAEALLRDLKALRRGGIHVAYSRQCGLEGYYLAYPALERSGQTRFNRYDVNWVQRVQVMSVPEKNEVAFAAADFALRQKRLILREEQPEWPPDQVEREARRLVFGVVPYE